jgi:putative endonuclease
MSDARRPVGRTTRQVGGEKELLAARYLQSQGLHLFERNHRCRFGEIDLIMGDEDCLVFVEVRYRRSSRFGRPEQTVDGRKQRRLSAAAYHYLQAHPTMLPCRFDVVAIVDQDQIQWFKNAFNASF